MLGVIGDLDRLVDQQHRNSVVDAVCAAKPRVVQEFLMAGVDQQQGTAVLRADQDAEQLLVEHGGALTERYVDGRAVEARQRGHAWRGVRTGAERVVSGRLIGGDLVLL